VQGDLGSEASGAAVEGGWGGHPPFQASSLGCLLQTGEGKSKAGFSHGQLISIASEFGDTGEGILSSLEETCLAVQWVTAICCHCGPFTCEPEMSYLHAVCLFWCHLSGSSQRFFFQKM